MFNLFAKPSARPAPHLRRVLVVDPDANRTRALAAMLGGRDGPDVWAAETPAKALKLAAKVDPQVIFCELAAERFDGVAFTRSLRRSDHACRKAAVILVAAGRDPQGILAARDAGAHEVLHRPIVARDLARHIEAALSPREWIEAMDYAGPDRRRFNSAEHQGARQRQADAPAPPHAVYVGEALKIIRTALAALESDPGQARRTLTTQAKILKVAAEAMADARLAGAAQALAAHLADAGPELAPAACRRAADDLMTYGGREQRAA